jgi:hypothetical protein
MTKGYWTKEKVLDLVIPWLCYGLLLLLMFWRYL